jgi:hypothetical protein
MDGLEEKLQGNLSQLTGGCQVLEASDQFRFFGFQSSYVETVLWVSLSAMFRDTGSGLDAICMLCYSCLSCILLSSDSQLFTVLATCLETVATIV